jgi:hypothetical protein
MFSTCFPMLANGLSMGSTFASCACRMAWLRKMTVHVHPRLALGERVLIEALSETVEVRSNPPGYTHSGSTENPRPHATCAMWHPGSIMG